MGKGLDQVWQEPGATAQGGQDHQVRGQVQACSQRSDAAHRALPQRELLRRCLEIEGGASPTPAAAAVQAVAGDSSRLGSGALTAPEAAVRAGDAEAQAAGGASARVSLEAEVPEALFEGMRHFLRARPEWDQYRVITSALAGFLFQNGCSDRCVAQHYLNGLFMRPGE